MLGLSRGRRASAGAAFAVVWANLLNQHPQLRTILVTGASERDDATAVAMGLAEAAVRAGRGPAAAPSIGESDGRVLVIVLGPAKHRVADSPAPSMRIVDAQSPGQVHTFLSDANQDPGLAIVVAPPPQSGSDCISLANAADATVLVATSGRTRFGDAQLAASFLRQVGVTPSAALLLSKETLRERSSRADASRLAEGGQRVGYGDRPAPPEIAG